MTAFVPSFSLSAGMNFPIDMVVMQKCPQNSQHLTGFVYDCINDHNSRQGLRKSIRA